MSRFDVWLFEYVLDLLHTPRTPSECIHSRCIYTLAPRREYRAALEAVIVIILRSSSGVRFIAALALESVFTTAAAVEDVTPPGVALLEPMHRALGAPGAPRFSNHFLRLRIGAPQAEFIFPVGMHPRHPLAPRATNHVPTAIETLILVT